MSDSYEITGRNKLKRVPKRGHYDKKTIYNILDHAYLAHVGFQVYNQPYVIPTLYGREGDIIYYHGATTSRLLQETKEGIDICMTVTLVDGLVLARSAFHHSMNYRSAVLFGNAAPVPDDKKLQALKVISDQVIPGRWEESRQPNEKELKATLVMAMQIEEASAKIRTGPPGDEKEDYELPIWAGVIETKHQPTQVLTDPLLTHDLPQPDSVKNFFSKNS